MPARAGRFWLGMSAFTDLEIRPARIVAFGIDPGGSASARSVG